MSRSPHASLPSRGGGKPVQYEDPSESEVWCNAMDQVRLDARGKCHFCSNELRAYVIGAIQERQNQTIAGALARVRAWKHDRPRIMCSECGESLRRIGDEFCCAGQLGCGRWVG